MKSLLSTVTLGMLLTMDISNSHTVMKQSFPYPKGLKHNKPKGYIEKLREQRRLNANNYGDRFLEQYNKMMNTSNGYFSSGGVPYHSVETLMCEAPDYGHETTSEAFSFYVWLTAEYGWYSGDFTAFQTAWSTLDTVLIPPTKNQPSESTEQYNPQSPAEYAPEEDSPSDYPVDLSTSTPVGVDPLNDELATVYGSSSTELDQIYGTHWLMDVDNIYGFGDQESGTKSDVNVFINTFQRGPNESVWRTIPQPDWENEKYGDPSGGGFQQLFTTDPNGAKPQWKYTAAPDADARTIQATYWALTWAADTRKMLNESKNNGNTGSSGTRSTDLSTEAKNAQKMGDFLRYALWDKYFKTIPCHDPSCPGTTWTNSWNSTFYLISWYYAWGGNIGSYDWSWRIGASHTHQGYQNVMTAYVLNTYPDLMSTTTSGVDHWGGVKARTLEYWQWLQSKDGAIAGGATNSWKGRYADPTEDGITGYFYGLAYDWQPVYHCPPSNNWFGMQVWSMERLAEYYYLNQDDTMAQNILKNWIEWFNTFVDDIFLDNDDWQIPSTLNWNGQPDTWTGSYTCNTDLTVTIIDYAKDVGTGSALVQILSYYAATTSDTTLQGYAAELLDRMYMNATAKGIDWTEERQDYVGNAYGKGFWEPVYVPEGYSGTYPNGDKIEPNGDFTDLRSWYKDDPEWDKVEDAYNTNTIPQFTYHRFWAQASYAIACADYSRLFEQSANEERKSKLLKNKNKKN